LFGFALPCVIAAIYLPRVVAEATVDDWMLLGFATLMTHASKQITPAGVVHEPWMLYLAVLWSMMACTTDRLRALRSIPLIGVYTFISVAVPDVWAAIYDRPKGMHAAPGGLGLLDGLVIKASLAIAVTGLAYAMKVWPILPNRQRRGKHYDEASRKYLLDLSPRYFRPMDGWEGTLNLLPTRADSAASSMQ
jgi:hypothetical protein